MKQIFPVLVLACAALFSNVSFGQFLYPGGETCEDAIPIVVADGYATPEDGAGTPDHWYTFVAPCDGDLTVSNSGADVAAKRIYSGVCGSLTLLAEDSWADTDVSVPLISGEAVYIHINDIEFEHADFNIEFDLCDEIDSALLDIEGFVYFDLNENGVRDIGEAGKHLTSIISSPAGVFAVSGADGHYYSSIAHLADGGYEIYPNLDEHWAISSDSLVYNIFKDGDYEQRDSLDFGIYPESIVYQAAPELVGGYPRCNDTINYWLNVQNTGTVIASGLVHFELDDSVYYVSADVAPDSIVGKNLYWSYEDLFFYDTELFTVQVGTPDGFEDTVTNILSITVDSVDVEVFASSETLTQVITCAYDPNDKTPTPLGEGEFGNIDPDTETLEYLIRFQNTGTDTAFNVVITDQLDENLIWNSISILAYSHDMMTYEMTPEGEVSFNFIGIMLPDSNVNVLGSQGFVKFKINLEPGLPLETSIYNTANIYFDFNPAIVTNTTVNTLHVDDVDDVGVDELTAEQVVIYPNPFSETTTVYFGEDLANYSVQILDLSGRQVYSNTELSGNQLELDASQFNSGMYVLVLIDNTSNQTVSTAKIIVQ